MQRALLLAVSTLLGGIVLFWGFQQKLEAAEGIAATPAQLPSEPITLIPAQLFLQGDVATSANAEGHCPEPWLSDMPPGSIILGVDPTSCDPSNWDGGAVTAEFFLPNPYTLTVMLLQLEWPDQESKGLHSPERNQTATITLDGRSIDGRSIWSQRTTHLRANGDYYATGHNTILTTFVLTQSITHTLSISVPAQTAWDLSEITLTAYPYPDKHRGVGYSPYWDCQSPETSFQPTEQAIREDLFRLFHTSTAMRTYAATGVNGLIPALANEIGLPIYAGAWLDGDEQADDLEIQALLTLANSTNLEGVIVGNEYYLRNRTETDLQYLLQKIEQVKAIVDPLGIPVTTAELDNLMFTWESGSAVVPTGINPTYRPILDEVDIVLVHIYPFWSGLPIDGAAAFTVNRYKAIQTLIEQEYPGQNKKVVIGEAGWPSLGSPPPWGNAAQPGFLHQEIYMLEFLKLAEQEAVEYFYFDAFDELWKIEEPGFVGQNWGYSYSDRAAKHYFYGVLLPEEKIPTPPRLEHKVYLPSIATTASQRFSVYTEWLAEHDGFLPTGATGDSEYVSVYECHPTQPHRGNMSIQASFSPGGPTGSGGVQWQYPADNWGDQEDGLDLSWANKLTFWARGNLGGEKARFFVGGIGDKDTPYPDSLRPVVSSGYMTLTDTWQQYTINLSGQDLSHVIGGFGWSTNQCANPAGATFYLDNIFFEYDPALSPPPAPGPTFPVYTDAAAQSNHYAPSGWMGDAEHPDRVSLTECWGDNPYSGETSIKVAYTQKIAGWAGIYWVHPANNWGERPGGYDLQGADRLTFWARSDTPGASVTFIVGGIGYDTDHNGNTICSSPSQPYPDSICPKIEHEATLQSTWTKYTINLAEYTPDLSGVVGGFGWVTDAEVVFYLDDIVYEFDQ